ncbi:MAG TPA: hypothetical protein PK156_19780 [Polyangium sp.]|nr:hypothetical protein [Polyangium sp.]
MDDELPEPPIKFIPKSNRRKIFLLPRFAADFAIHNHNHNPRRTTKADFSSTRSKDFAENRTCTFVWYFDRLVVSNTNAPPTIHSSSLQIVPSDAVECPSRTRRADEPADLDKLARSTWMRSAARSPSPSRAIIASFLPFKPDREQETATSRQKSLDFSALRRKFRALSTTNDPQRKSFNGALSPRDALEDQIFDVAFSSSLAISPLDLGPYANFPYALTHA